MDVIAKQETARRKLLGTRENMIIFFFFNLFQSFGYGLNPSLNWYVQYYKMAIIYLVIAGSIGGIIGVYTQVFIGYYGDLVKSTFGRRKPLVFLGVVINIICIIGYALPPAYTQQALFGWYLFWTIMQSIASSIQGAPYISWLIESTADNEDYVRIVTLPSQAGSVIGFIAGVLLGNQILPIVGALIYAIGYAISIFFLLKYVHNDCVRATEKQPDMVPSFRTCMRTKEFQIIFYNRILISAGYAIGFGNGLYLLVVGFSFVTRYSQIALFVSVIAALYFLFGAVAVISLNWILAYYEKLFVYKIITLVIGVLGVVIFLACLAGNEASFYATCFFLIILGALVGPISAIDNFFLKDLIIYDTFLTGLNRENMYQTALALPANLGTSIIATIPSIILYGMGFISGTNTSTDDQIISKFIVNDRALWAMRVFCSLLMSVIAIASYFIIRPYPLNDPAAKRIQEIVNSRMSNKPEGLAGKEELEGEICGNNYIYDGGEELSAGRESLVDRPEEEMLMLHFSQAEVRSLATKGADGVAELKTKNAIGVVLGFIALAFVCASSGIQIISQVQTYITLLITLLLLCSLYVFYDVLRANALMKLSSYSRPKQEQMIHAAVKYNETMKARLEQSFNKFGIEDTGAEGNDEVSKRMTLAQPVDETTLRLPGYKRIYSSLVAIIVFSTLCFTVLVSSPINPSNHTPSYMPTHAPI